MALDLADCKFHGQAIPEPFAKTSLEKLLRAAGLLPEERGADGMALVEAWDEYRRALSELPSRGGPPDVARHVLEPLAARLGYGARGIDGGATTREGIEDGGWVFQTKEGQTLRAFATGFGARLDAPRERGRPRRFGPMQIAMRVMQAKDEPLALLTNGIELRVLLRDPARRESHVAISLEPPGGWRGEKRVPDSFRLLLAIASPAGVSFVPALLEEARLETARITAALRAQAKTALLSLLNELVDDPRNASFFSVHEDQRALALWRDALVVVHRLLFRLKLEASGFAGGESLFGEHAAPLFDEERASRLFSALSFAPPVPGEARQRVSYGSLAVEDLGRVYEALLEVEPGIAAAPMCRLRRQKLEVVVPRAQAEAHCKNASSVSFVEDIREGAFYLRAGLGRKTTGSYYTPPALVRFLIEETLGPRIAARSPADDPRPAEILKLTVLDPAVGSGHFLVEACRFLGDELYDACFLCDERASVAEEAAERAENAKERAELLSCAASWRKRVLEMPDASAEWLAYSSRRTGGISEARAKALCRRLVAAHCLYGVDENPLAVELAKLSLWLTSYAEGLPLPSLDHRLVEGNSLTGPMFANLASSSKGDARLQTRLSEALAGQTLAPLRTLAAAWSGAAMLGDDADDAAYEALREAVATNEDVEALVSARPELQRWIEAGKKAIAYDLRFPEVFYPGGRAGERAGFSAVVGNPPWDAIQPHAKEFYAALDLSVLDAPTRLERAAVEERLNEGAEVRRAFERYVAGLEGTKRAIGRWSRHVNRSAGGAPCGAIMDLWQGFAERGRMLWARTARSGWSYPLRSTRTRAPRASGSSTSTTRGSGNVTRSRTAKRYSRFTGASSSTSSWWTEAPRPPRSSSARSTSAGSIGSSGRRARSCTRGISFGARAAGTRRCSSSGTRKKRSSRAPAAPIRSRWAKFAFRAASAWGRSCTCRRRLISSRGPPRRPSPRMDPREPEAARIARKGGFLPLHEGKTFHQYTDRWDEPPRYLVALSKLAEKPGSLRAASFHRLAFRAIASSTNERTAIFALLPPGTVFGNSAPCEREPWARPTKDALLLLACANTFVFDWNLRRRSTANVNPFILDGCPLPPCLFEGPRAAFLVHAALRLTCNHEGYAPLFREQLGPFPRQTFPVLANEGARAAVRAAIDAVVAAAYGLGREQYAEVLSSFSHKSHPEAPERCLAAFDELARIGQGAFAQANDPYHDVPLREKLAAPVLDLR